MRYQYESSGRMAGIQWERNSNLSLRVMLAGILFASHPSIRNFSGITIARRQPRRLRRSDILSSCSLQSDPGYAMIDGCEELEERLVTASDQEKAAIHNTLSRRLLRNDPARALQHAKQGLSISARLKDRALQAESYINCANASSGLARFASAERWVRRARRLYEKAGDKLGQADSDAVISEVYKRTGRYSEALELINSALVVFQEHERHESVASVFRTIGTIYDELGDYPQALDYYYRSLNLLEEHGAPIQRTLLSLMVLYHRIKDEQKSLEFGERALALYRQDNDRRGEVMALGNIGIVHYYLNNLDAYRDYTVQALAIAREMGDPAGEAHNMRALGSYYYYTEQLDEAIRWYTEAHRIACEINDRPQVMALLIDIGEAYVKGERDSEAYALFNEALCIASETGSREGEQAVHQNLYRWYEESGDATQALYHYKEYVTIKEEVTGTKQLKALTAVQTRFEIEKAERDREIFRLKTERLELEVQHKVKELTALAMQLVQKNELLDELKKQIGELAASRPGGAESSQDLAPSLRQIDTSRNSEQEWEVFEQQFRALHPEFMDQLARQCAELSPTELKVCALLKINLATKEIANVLCCSPRTVEDHRYRIRTKMDLPKGVNLLSHLARL